MRHIPRRLRAIAAMRSHKMRVRAHWPWYVRWSINAALMVLAGVLVFWVLDNQHKVTGFNPRELKERLSQLEGENQSLKGELDQVRRQIKDRDQEGQVDRAAQGELSKSMTQLQDENAGLKEDLGFLRNMMGSGGQTLDGLSISNFKLEPELRPGDYRYRLLLTQGGQKKQEFKGRFQLIARVILKGGAEQNLSFPEDSVAKQSADVSLVYYQKIEGRLTLPEGATLKALEARVLAIPGGQVKLSKVIKLP